MEWQTNATRPSRPNSGIGCLNVGVGSQYVGVSDRQLVVLDFLGSLFSEGLQYRSINTIRSAVSVTHPHISGSPIGQHALVTRLMKGIYNSRPLAPRYTSSWDMGQVTSYWGPLLLHTQAGHAHGPNRCQQDLRACSS